MSEDKRRFLRKWIEKLEERLEEARAEYARLVDLPDVGDIVRIREGEYAGRKGRVLRVDLELDAPHLVRANGTSSYGRYAGDELDLLCKYDYDCEDIPVYEGERIRWRGGSVLTLGPGGGRFDPIMGEEFLMPKRKTRARDELAESMVVHSKGYAGLR